MNLPLLISLLLLTLNTHAQYYSRTPTCATEIERVYKYSQHKYSDTSTYAAVECLRPSHLGLRVEIGRADYKYNTATQSWLGTHHAAVIGLSLAVDNFNIGIRYKFLSTVTPNRPIVLGSDTFQSPATFSADKLDYTLSYSFSFRHNVSIEPFIGYTKGIFYAVHDSGQNKKKVYTAPPTHGLITGVAVNKYIRLRSFEYLALFISAAYATSDFRKLDPSLGRGYIEWTYGIAYKGFPNHYFYKKVE